jgi:hypothetical protein
VRARSWPWRRNRNDGLVIGPASAVISMTGDGRWAYYCRRETIGTILLHQGPWRVFLVELQLIVQLNAGRSSEYQYEGNDECRYVYERRDSDRRAGAMNVSRSGMVLLS